MFQHQYTLGADKNSTTIVSTCAHLTTPFSAPLFELGPEGAFAGAVRAVGLRDIEIESPAFNRLFKVRCDDQRFAVTLLDQPMIGWLIEHAVGLHFSLIATTHWWPALTASCQTSR